MIESLENFHIVLPSNTKSVPGNRTGDYRTVLPQVLKFDTPYMVALQSISYPLSFPTLGRHSPQFIRFETQQGESFQIDIPKTTHLNLDDFLRFLNQEILAFPSSSPARKKRKVEENERANEKAEEPGQNIEIVPAQNVHLPENISNAMANEKSVDVAAQASPKTNTQVPQAPPPHQNAKSSQVTDTPDISSNQKDAQTSPKTNIQAQQPSPPDQNVKAAQVTDQKASQELPKTNIQVPQPPPPDQNVAPKVEDITQNADKKADTSSIASPTQPTLLTNKEAKKPAANVATDPLQQSEPAPSNTPISNEKTQNAAATAPSANVSFTGAKQVAAPDPDKNIDISEQPPNTFVYLKQQYLKDFWERESERITFEYSKASQRIIINIPKNIKNVFLSDQLAYMLGFSDKQNLEDGTESTYIVDLSGDLNFFVIYAEGLSAPIVLGDRLTNALQVVHIKGEHGTYSTAHFNQPIFIPVEAREISEIHIRICSLTGETIEFEHGTVVVTLAFKRAVNY